MLQAGREKSQDEELHRQRGPVECGLAWAVAGLQLSVDGFEALESAPLVDPAWVTDRGWQGEGPLLRPVWLAILGGDQRVTNQRRLLIVMPRWPGEHWCLDKQSHSILIPCACTGDNTSSRGTEYYPY
jgi:hypothetical protein